MIVSDPNGQWILVPDLGIDKVMLYRLDSARGTLVPQDPAYLELAAGAGPRHLAFDPAGRFLYVINELDNTVTAFRWDSAAAATAVLETHSTLPAEFKEWSSCADIHVAPSGSYLYGSNRGHDSIAIFAIDTASGRLSFVGHESTGGKIPRAFAIVAEGQRLIVTNQHSDSVVSFVVDEASGSLTPSGHEISIPAPLCVKV
jgi:6-phosphogluconolactonase